MSAENMTTITRKTRRNYRLLVAAAVLAVTLISTDSFAKSSGGFTGPGPDVVTVQQALSMRDDAKVSLKGNIVRSLGDEDYIFKDATGTIEVEIDNDIWRGLSIGPEDVIVISGEVDKSWNHTSVDVDSVTKQ